MSLSTANFSSVVKRQFLFKLKAYIDSFSSLVGIQLIAMLFSLGGSFSSGSFSGELHLELKYYSADMVIIFTMIWSFVTALTITTKPYRNQDFTFVTNRVTSSISNILFLIVACLLAAMTAMLSKYLLSFAALLFTDGQLYMATIDTWDMLIGFLGSFLYMFVTASLGYLIGTMVQINKVFALIIPVVLIGSLFLDMALQQEPFVEKIFRFYVMESSLLLFAAKIILTCIVIFATSIQILNRMEVRR